MSRNRSIMITCSEATDYISRKEEGKLSWQQRLKLRFHLLLCGLCKRFSIQNGIIVRMAKGEEKAAQLPEELKVVLKDGLRT